MIRISKSLILKLDFIEVLPSCAAFYIIIVVIKVLKLVKLIFNVYEFYVSIHFNKVFFHRQYKSFSILIWRNYCWVLSRFGLFIDALNFLKDMIWPHKIYYTQS